MKRILKLLSIVLLVLSPIKVLATNNYKLSNSSYTISKYDVNIIVNEDNTYDITENIEATFNVPKHGIIRSIPLKNTINRLDGTSTTNRARLTNLYVSEEYEKSREQNNLKIRIGSSSTTITGEHDYTIKYKYNIGKDKLKDKDELYFNIIGSEWDTTIDNISFTISMPFSFDETKLGFSSGSYGSTDNELITYSIKDNVITGIYNGTLKSRQGITVRCELEEGYFKYKEPSKLIYLLFIIPTIFAIISFILWRIFGRDDKVIETVEFYPPANSNSLEVGFLYKGNATSKDVTSLLIYLANKGYVKITEIPKKNRFSNNSFKITKVKDYDGNNECESIFLNGLFKSASKDKDEISVREIDLHDSFYRTMNRILVKTNSRKNKKEIFESSTISKSILVVLMVILTFCLITIPPFLIYGDTSNLSFALMFTGIGFLVMISSLSIKGYSIGSNIAAKLIGLIWGLLFGGIPWIMVVLPVLLDAPICLYIYIWGIFCIIFMFICLAYLPKRTPYGNEILGRIRGFKNFLEAAEKEKLESLVLDNPTYFYDILPYTYVLGVSDKWIKQFESINLSSPTWYESSKKFDVITFNSAINNTLSSANQTFSSTPSSSSGGSSGGFSGGGFSGGGSGGGGGSSW